MTFLPPAVPLVLGIKDEMKPKYHARPPAPCHSPPHHHHHHPVARYLYRLHLSLECRESPSFSPLFSTFLATDRREKERESVLLARKTAKNSPVIESILCKPISDPRLPVTTLSSQARGTTLSFSSPRVLPSTESDMPPKESIVYSPTSAPLFPLSPPFLSLPPLSICVQILNHVGVGENESGKGPDEAA